MGYARCMNCMKMINTGATCPHCGTPQQTDVNYPYAMRPNTILHGKYLIGRVLGMGFSDITYVGFDTILERKVAVKEYFPHGLVGETTSFQDLWKNGVDSYGRHYQGVNRFLAFGLEMEKLGSLPGIVSVRDVFRANQTGYLVMEFVEGENLRSRIKTKGPESFETCTSLFGPLIDSLGKLHRQGLLHKNIFPDTILAQENGSCVLLYPGTGQPSSSYLSEAMSFRDSHLPPECLTEKGACGPWTDVYELCAAMYYTVTGKDVPAAMGRIAADRNFLESAVQYTVRGTYLPYRAVPILRAGLAVDPKERPQSMDALKRLLQQEVAEQNSFSQRDRSFFPEANIVGLVYGPPPKFDQEDKKR